MLAIFNIWLCSASGTNRYFRRVASEFGLKVSFVDCTQIKLLEAAITPQTKVTADFWFCLFSQWCFLLMSFLLTRGCNLTPSDILLKLLETLSLTWVRVSVGWEHNYLECTHKFWGGIPTGSWGRWEEKSIRQKMVNTLKTSLQGCKRKERFPFKTWSGPSWKDGSVVKSSLRGETWIWFPAPTLVGP